MVRLSARNFTFLLFETDVARVASYQSTQNNDITNIIFVQSGRQVMRNSLGKAHIVD